MAHSTMRCGGRIYEARDEVIANIVAKFGRYARQMNIRWLSEASKEWAEHCEIMPPGAKVIEFDRWLSDNQRRQEIIAAIDFVAAETHDPNVLHLMHLDDLKACLQSPR